MEVENIILHEVSQAQKAKKSCVLPHMWIIDLKQMHQYFGTQVALRGGCAREGIGKKPNT
jgi:hypothetical protein